MSKRVVKVLRDQEGRVSGIGLGFAITMTMSMPAVAVVLAIMSAVTDVSRVRVHTFVTTATVMAFPIVMLAAVTGAAVSTFVLRFAAGDLVAELLGFSFETSNWIWVLDRRAT